MGEKGKQSALASLNNSVRLWAIRLLLLVLYLALG